MHCEYQQQRQPWVKEQRGSSHVEDVFLFLVLLYPIIQVQSWIYPNPSSALSLYCVTSFITMSSSKHTGVDDFVNISFALEDDGSEAQKMDKDFYSQWVDRCMLRSIIFFHTISIYIVASANHSGPAISG